MSNANEIIIWQFLKSQQLTDAGAAGLMGNLYAESGLKPNNLQNSYEKILGFTDVTYTEAVDKGTYNNFIHDKAGYGLAQWTWWSRKEALLNYAKQKKQSIGNLQMQLEFLILELKNSYIDLLKILKTTKSVRAASNEVLLKFERPADQSLSVKNKRASYSQIYYDKFANQIISIPIGEQKMKYNENNKPLVCIQKNSTCYKQTRIMQPVGILWHSTGANNPNLKRYVQPYETDSNYDEMIKLLGKNTNKTDWNHSIQQAGLNCWIGKLANSEVAAIQTMPWDYRPWGCGSGPKGSCNNGWIQFEICEDDLNDENYFNQVYKEACEITAYLCKMYNLNPYGTVKVNGVNIPVILCHADSHKLGFGSNHGDIMHWFPKYGKSMETVRDDVAALLKNNNINITIPKVEEEEEMTQEQFNTMMNNWIAEQAKKNPGDWSNDAREWGERNGLINGDSNGNKMYKKMMTREEFITVLYRALHRNLID